MLNHSLNYNMHTGLFIMHSCNLINIHSYNYVSCTAELIMHSHKHSFNIVHHIQQQKYNCRGKIGKITYLMKNSTRNQLRRCNVPPNHRPACSLISQQRCHPRAGHDSPRNKEQAGLHITKGTPKHIQANTVGFIRPYRSQERLNAKLVSSLQSQGHLHQNQPDL